jgi:hypothetical protein
MFLLPLRGLSVGGMYCIYLQAIMGSWTYSCTGPEYYETEMDREFLLELRELRILLDKEKEHKQ